VRLFSAIGFLITAVFYVVGQVLVGLGRDHPLSPAGHAALLATLLLMLGTRLYCRRDRVRSERTLRALEAVLLPVLGLLVLLTPAGAIPEPELHGMVALLAVSLLLYTRSIFIPSSARRTLAVSAATARPAVAAAGPAAAGRPRGVGAGVPGEGPRAASGLGREGGGGARGLPYRRRVGSRRGAGVVGRKGPGPRRGAPPGDTAERAHPLPARLTSAFSRARSPLPASTCDAPSLS
jgi:hypothetical protein